MRSRRLDLVLGVLFAGHIAAAFMWRSWHQLAEAAPVCWLRGLVGIECPFCGMTRSFVATAGGELDAAMHLHPGGPILFAFMLGSIAWIAAAAIRKTPPVWLRRGYLTGFAAVAALCVTLGVARTLWT